MTQDYQQTEKHKHSKGQQDKNATSEFTKKSYYAKIPMLLLIGMIIARVLIPDIALPGLWVYFYLTYIYSIFCIFRFVWCLLKFPEWTRQQRELVQSDRSHVYNAKHLTIITIYKEALEVIFETLEVIANTSSASRMTIVLAMEERDPQSRQRSATVIQKFQGRFQQVVATFHPSNIPGEQAGKGSNEAWAFKKLVLDGDFEERSENNSQWDLVHILDVDTHHRSEYYQTVEYKWAKLSKSDRDKAIFSGPMHFDRNYNEVAWPVRVVDTFWSIAALGTLYPGSNAIIPMSSYSASVEFVKLIGGWDGDVFAIGEDLHFMVKSYFASDGNVVMVPIYIPGSSLHVDNGRVDTKGYMGDVHARFDQAVRHLWGTLEFAYTLDQIIKKPHLLLRYKCWVVVIRILECALFFLHTYIVSWLCLFPGCNVWTLLWYTWVNSTWMCAAMLMYTLGFEKIWGRTYTKCQIIANAIGILFLGPIFGFAFLIFPLVNAQWRHLFNVQYRGWKVTTTNNSTKPAEKITKQGAEEYQQIMSYSTEIGEN